MYRERNKYTKMARQVKQMKKNASDIEQIRKIHAKRIKYKEQNNYALGRAHNDEQEIQQMYIKIMGVSEIRWSGQNN